MVDWRTAQLGLCETGGTSRHSDCRTCSWFFTFVTMHASLPRCLTAVLETSTLTVDRRDAEPALVLI